MCMLDLLENWSLIKVLLQAYLTFSWPSLRWEGDVRLTGASSKEGKRAESPPMFIWGKRRKKRNMWCTNFKCERFTSCFYSWGRYYHLTRLSQGTTAFNQMCNYDFKTMYFPFSCFFYVFSAFICVFVFFFTFVCFFMFFTFLWWCQLMVVVARVE